ncbi:hypothetical protein QOZ95_002775 [Paenibacillus brasilensis]|uniref:Secreted protein n=1 Tax=Paenibacillus brasilensis TaxID=128574 RepID=A0ABU0KYW7_9BACL|nr:hypothetical protein [Paenibacillus brasilensis]
MNRSAANRLKSTLFLKLVCVAFLTHKRTYLALRKNETKEVERERSGRNGAVEALAFALKAFRRKARFGSITFPDFNL